MRRAIAVLGIVLTMSLAVVGCGGVSSTAPPNPPLSLNRLRTEIRPIMDERLAKFGASMAQIACVDHVIESGPMSEIKRRLEQGNAVSPLGPKKTPKEVAGALGGSCF